MQTPARSMVVGAPARVLRQLTDEEVARKVRDTDDYIALAQRSLDTMHEVEALSAIEPNRRRISVPQHAAAGKSSD
jgi:phenylacetic acid degradation protein